MRLHLATLRIACLEVTGVCVCECLFGMRMRNPDTSFIRDFDAVQRSVHCTPTKQPVLRIFTDNVGPCFSVE